MKTKYKNLDELIEILVAQKEDINEHIEALQSRPTSFEEKLLLKYIENCSTPDVANFAKSKGKRTSKGALYQPADISVLIQDDSKNINPILLRMAREIFRANKRSVDYHTRSNTFFYFN